MKMMDSPSMSRDQMEHLYKEHIRENEQLRRQIAEVKSQANQSFAILVK